MGTHGNSFKKNTIPVGFLKMKEWLKEWPQCVIYATQAYFEEAKII